MINPFEAINEVLGYNPVQEGQELVGSRLDIIKKGVRNVLQDILTEQSAQDIAGAPTPLPVVREQANVAASPIAPDSHEYALVESMSPKLEMGLNEEGLRVYETHVRAAQAMVERAGPISYGKENQ